MPYPTQLFTNNAVSLLAQPISAAATSLRVIAGMGALFPQPVGDGSDYFLITLENEAATTREIIRVTGRSGDIFTQIVRAQEGTPAQAWGASTGNETLVDHRITAETMRLAMLLPEIPAPVTPGIDGVITEDEGSPLTTPATTYNFVGAGVTVTGSGTEKTITIPGATAGTSITVQDEGSSLGVASTLNFVGPGITVSGSGATKTITVPGVSAPSLIIQDNSTPLQVAITNINFVGAGVSVSGSGPNATVSIPGAVAPTPIIVQDEGTSLPVAAATFNFVGAGVTATGTTGIKTITIPGATPLTVQDEGTSLPMAAETINFVGAGVTVSGGGNVKTVNIPGATGGGTAWINGENVGPTEIDPGWTLPVSTVTYSQFNRGFKFIVTIVMPINGMSSTFEVLANVSGNLSSNNEDAYWTRYSRIGYNFAGVISVVLDKPNNSLSLQWHNQEANRVQVMCTRVQHSA